MNHTTSTADIKSIFCPSDLSEKSQRALGYSVRLAEKLHATLTAGHCAAANWFTQENRLPHEERARIKGMIQERVAACQDPAGTLDWRSVVIENSFDPARDILALSREVDADLIVMKTRPGVLSAFRFGSIVERVVAGSSCPILLLPSRFLETHDPANGELEFRHILFDYDFSEATDQLFHLANALTRDYHADLRLISVVEPPKFSSTEAAVSALSRTAVQTMIRSRLDDVLHTEGRSIMDVPTTVEWGSHAETVLRHAKEKNIDLICTALAPPDFYFDKLYSSYLGSLLRSTSCPILVKQSARISRAGDNGWR
jgi:nucleotide-binding universal stress UspA family protein